MILRSDRIVGQASVDAGHPPGVPKPTVPKVDEGTDGNATARINGIFSNVARSVPTSRSVRLAARSTNPCVPPAVTAFRRLPLRIPRTTIPSCRPSCMFPFQHVSRPSPPPRRLSGPHRSPRPAAMLTRRQICPSLPSISPCHRPSRSRKLFTGSPRTGPRPPRRPRPCRGRRSGNRARKRASHAAPPVPPPLPLVDHLCPSGFRSSSLPQVITISRIRLRSSRAPLPIPDPKFDVGFPEGGMGIHPQEP